MVYSMDRKEVLQHTLHMRQKCQLLCFVHIRKCHIDEKLFLQQILSMCSYASTIFHVRKEILTTDGASGKFIMILVLFEVSLWATLLDASYYILFGIVSVSINSSPSY